MKTIEILQQKREKILNLAAQHLLHHAPPKSPIQQQAQHPLASPFPRGTGGG